MQRKGESAQALVPNQVWIKLPKAENNQHFSKEFLAKIKQSTEKRVFRDNGKNSHSSRSHHIFQIRITHFESSQTKVVSYLNVVDLAGSERREKQANATEDKENHSTSLLAKHSRVRSTQETEDLQNEAIFINKSLSTLGRIFKILADQNDQGQPPYRESKLTQILQPSL